MQYLAFHCNIAITVTFVGLMAFVCHISMPWVSFGSVLVCLPKYWPMEMVGSDILAAFEKIFYLPLEEMQFWGRTLIG